MTIEEQIRTYILADSTVASLVESYSPFYMDQTVEQDLVEVLDAVVVRLDKVAFSEMQALRIVSATMQVFCFSRLKDTALAIAEAVRERIDRAAFSELSYCRWLNDRDSFDEKLRAHYQVVEYQIEYIQNF